MPPSHPLRAALPVALLCVVTGAGSAAAATPSRRATATPRITLSAPKHALASDATHKRPYAVTVSGQVTTAAVLQVFVDYDACAATPTKERSNGAPTVTYFVHGRFTHRSAWSSGVRGVDHVCVYLTDRATGRLLVKRSATFEVR